MQLHVYNDLHEPLELPIGYRHIVQSILYTALGASNSGLGDLMHDDGYRFGKRRYKSFVFSDLDGPYSIQGGRIIFREHVAFEVRSPDGLVIGAMRDGIRKNGIRYGSRSIAKVSATTRDAFVESTDILVRMKSPLTVYSTDPESGYTLYYSPDDAQFEGMLRDNFFRKYSAYYGVEPDGFLAIEPFRVGAGDRVVAKYKGHPVTAWKGEYHLQGRRKYLDFLFQTGIGGKNSQGFGMFDIIAEG